MPSQLLELGASNLLELGATQLLELGETRLWMGGTPVPASIYSVYDFVKTFEDPLSALDIKDSELESDELHLVNKIRDANRRIRYSLGSSVSLGDVVGHDYVLGLMYELGKKKSIFKKIANLHKSVYKKVSKVVKSPAFLSVASLVVNVIPGVGQAASVALAAAAAARKGYETKIAQKKQLKKERQLNAQQQAEFAKQITEYNRQTQAYYVGLNQPIPSGALLDSDGNPTNDPSKAPGITYPINITGYVFNGPPTPASTVTLPAQVVPPLTSTAPPPTQQQVAQYAALPMAAALQNGENVAQARQFLSSFEPQMQQQIAKELPEVQKYVSDPSFKPTSLKAIGQFVAMSEFDEGAGTNLMTSEQHALANQIKENASDEVWKAIEAGRQDLITTAALDGQSSVQMVKDAIASGSSTGPSWKTIGLVGLGLAVVGGGVYALTRR